MKRFLLVTAALTTAAGCRREEPLPGNPKGSFYADAAPMLPTAAPTPPPTPEEASAPASASPKPSAAPTTTATTTVHPLPANPKGSHYDKGSGSSP